MRINQKASNKSTISSQLFNELADKNVRKSAKDYFIYFFTLTLSVCLFYSFNSISTQFTSLGLEDTLNYLAFASTALTVFSVLVCFIMGALVVYANRFLLRRRKKEMGIYATLGMERNDLNRLLMKETIRIGAFSLLAGLILGVFASQILALITARMIGLDLSAYHFLISIKAVVLSVIFFGILFFIVHRFNVRELKKMSLLDMLYADRKNETIAESRNWLSILGFILSIIIMITGYGIIKSWVNETLIGAIALGGLLLMIGNLLFFTTVFRFTAKWMKKNKSFYFRGLNMFTASQFSSRVKTEGRSVAMTSVLLFLSLSLIILGPGIGKFVMNGIEQATPFDGSISYAPQAGGQAASGDPMTYLENSGFKITAYTNAYQEFWIYHVDSITDEFLGQRQDEQANSSTGSDLEEPSFPLPIIGMDDYNRLLELQNMEPISLGENEFAVSYAFPPLEKTITAFRKNPQPLKIGDSVLTLKDNGVLRQAWQNHYVLLEQAAIIVPQHLTEGLEPQMWYLNFNISGDTSEFNALLYNNWFQYAPEGYQMWLREEAIITITSDNLLMTYLGIYLGITFLITAGAVLAIQQLSQSTDNTKRYNLLKKLGASKKIMRKSLMKQLRVYFGLPILLAVLHSAVITGLVFPYFQGMTLAMMISIIGSGALLVFTVYTIYFVTTYLGSRRILQL